MTLQQAAQQALDVQDACNLSGIVRSFRRIAQEVLVPEAERLGKGTDWINEHPITKLFVDKFASLARTQWNLPTNILPVLVGLETTLFDVLWPLAHDNKLAKNGTDGVNQHPAAQALVAVLQILSKSEGMAAFHNAYDECQKLAKPVENAA